MDKLRADYIPPQPTVTEKLGDRIPTEPSGELPLDAYERMCAALYAYRFGTISFLDLLNRFEEILDIKSAQSISHHVLDIKE